MGLQVAWRLWIDKLVESDFVITIHLVLQAASNIILSPYFALPRIAFKILAMQASACHREKKICGRQFSDI